MKISSKIICTAFFALLLAACSTVDEKRASINFSDNAQLALSPNGSKLLVTWNDKNGDAQAKLVEFAANNLTSIRNIELPAKTFTTSFAKNDEYLLITTNNDGASNLLKLDIEKQQLNVIYQSSSLLRFPLEIVVDQYAFLEGRDGSGRSSQWKSLSNGVLTLLNEKGYGMATRLDIIGNSLFLLEPWSPPAFRAIQGSLPLGLNSMIKKDTFLVKCADRMPLTCLIGSIFLEPGGSQFVGGIELIDEHKKCKPSGYWRDPREVQISREGNVAVFHAQQKKNSETRILVVINNREGKCAVSQITLGDD